MRRVPRLVLVLATVLTLASACVAPTSRAGSTARIERVIDGDTVDVSIGGSVETARLLGIDTPETKHPTRPVECFGPEAADRLSQLLPAGTLVDLERDVEARDRFGRLLVYVRRVDDGLDVNLTMVAEGYAGVLVIEPNGAHASELRAAQQRARAGAAGLWGSCGDPHRAP